MKITTEDYKKDVSIRRSNGRMNSGVTFYIRPKERCFNRDRPLIIYNDADLEKRVKRMIAKWYWPMKYYKIDNVVIGANSESNALLEYWRVCDPSKKGEFVKAVEIIGYKKD